METEPVTSQPIAEVPRPRAENFRSGRKIYLVPMLASSPGAPEEYDRLMGRYWGEVRGQVEGLERTLSRVTHVYHEAICSGGEEGLRTIEQINPHGFAYVNVLCQSTAALEATELIEDVTESYDWRYCLSIGLASEKVIGIASESLANAMNRRHERIASVIDETLGSDEAGLCVLSADHKVQFPGDVQVFYVSPPALDDIRRFANEHARRLMAQAGGSAPSSTDDEPGKGESKDPSGSDDTAQETDTAAPEEVGDAEDATESDASPREYPEYPY